MTAATILGIDLNLNQPHAVVATAGAVAAGTISVPPAAGQREGAVLVGAGAEGRAGYRSDLLHRFGDRSFVAVFDTYLPADHLVGMYLKALCHAAENAAGARLGIVSIACHPVWDSRRRWLLERCARRAGLSDVRIMTAPEAAAWAPGPEPGPADALAVVVDLTSGTIALLAPASEGYQLIRHAPLDNHTPPGVLAHRLLTSAGRSRHELAEIRLVGAGAADKTLVSLTARDFSGRVRVPAAPASAVAIGAAHRWLDRSPSRRLPPTADIVERLSALAADCDRRGDQATATQARAFGQKIFELRMGIHKGAADQPTTHAAVLQQAEALLRAHSELDFSSGGGHG